MAITTETIGTIENLETGEIEALTVHTAETPEDLAELLGIDWDALEDFEIAPGEFVPLSGLIDAEDRF